MYVNFTHIMIKHEFVCVPTVLY